MKCMRKEAVSLAAVSNRRDSNLGTLSEDLIMDILVRLPVESLLCVESVCKELQTLISSRAFIKLRQSLCLKNPKTLIQADDWFIYTSSDDITNYQYLDQPYIPFTTEYQECNFEIIGSFNGIVQMLDYLNTSDYLRFILWNPATGKYKIEKFPAPLPGHAYFNMIHAAFVFIRSSNTYKLASIYRRGSIYLCTNKDCLWRCIGSCGTVRNRAEFVQANDCLNWLNDDNFEEVIVSVDMEREIVFKTKVGKVTRNGMKLTRKLVVSGESELWMLVYPPFQDVPLRSIEWIEIHRGYLSKPNNCWNMTLHSTIKIPKIRNIQDPLGFWLHSDDSNNEIDNKKIILTDGHNTFLYNLTDETFSEALFIEDYAVCKTFPHIDTIESVNLSFCKYPEEVKTGKE